MAFILISTLLTNMNFHFFLVLVLPLDWRVDGSVSEEHDRNDFMVLNI